VNKTKEGPRLLERGPTLAAEFRKRPSPFLPDAPYSEAELIASSLAEFKRMIAGLTKLMEHYGIKSREDGSQWFLLSWKLAVEFIPYFQTPAVGASKPGRPARWTRRERLALWMRVEVERHTEHCTVTAACKRLAQSEFKRDDADSLHSRYKEAQRLVRDRQDIPEVKLMSRVFAEALPKLGQIKHG
jgi:hypothetical protein